MKQVNHKLHIRNAMAWLLALSMASCGLNELDNFDAPDTQLHGCIIDIDTGEKISSELYNGAQIAIQQLGYETPANQYLLIDANGEYRNNLLFAGRYRIRPYNRNFIGGSVDTIDIRGDTQYDFHVRPYVRFINPQITLEGQKVVAKFRIKNNLDSAGVNIKQMALFLYDGPMVGSQLRNAASKVMTVNTNYPEDEEMTLTLNLASHINDVEPGKTYSFRLGAQSAQSAAYWNFSPIFNITMPSQITEDPVDGVLFSNCDKVSTSGVGAWSANNVAYQPKPTVDGFDFTEGDASIKWELPTSIGKRNIFMIYQSNYGIKTGYTIQNGALKFDLYISDKDAIQINGGRMEINSAGVNDRQQLQWQSKSVFASLNLHNGWNHVSLPLRTAARKDVGGVINLDNLRRLRFFFTATILCDSYWKLDNVRIGSADN